MRDCRRLVGIANEVRSCRCVYCCRSALHARLASSGKMPDETCSCVIALFLAQLQKDDQVYGDVKRYHQCRYQADRQ